MEEHVIYNIMCDATVILYNVLPIVQVIAFYVGCYCDIVKCITSDCLLRFYNLHDVSLFYVIITVFIVLCNITL